MVNKGDDASKERESEAGRGGEGEEPCCDPKHFAHGHPGGKWFKRGWRAAMMRGAGACCGPTPVQINIVVPEQFSCCAPDQDCCTDEECCNEEQAESEK